MFLDILHRLSQIVDILRHLFNIYRKKFAGSEDNSHACNGHCATEILFVIIVNYCFLRDGRIVL